jgi:hypothetical protein
MAISLFSQTSGMSAWKQMESWHAKQKEYTAQLESSTSELMSALNTSFSSANDGLIQITVNRAIAAAQVRAAQRAAQKRGDSGGVDFGV